VTPELGRQIDTNKVLLLPTGTLVGKMLYCLGAIAWQDVQFDLHRGHFSLETNNLH
jgi:hypothetical protein